MRECVCVEMKELDFDIAIGTDGGRALYRTLAIFATLHAYKTIYTQIDQNANKWV